LVGERTNVLGSRAFKQIVAGGDFEAAAEVGRAQLRAGAQVLDVCLQDPDRDELADVELLLDKLVRVVKAPLMIDTTDARVMERALAWCQGKSILNSINLEDGLGRFEKVVALGRRYGAAYVVGLIDEQGMAVTVARKLEVARRSYRILTEEMGVAPEDIWWDPLVFPCGTGRRGLLGQRLGDDRRCARGEGGVSAHQDHPRRLERQLRSAAVGPRGAELGVPLSRDARRGSTRRS
jgi:5-methyltetrahydrofolate--homocysteine methyltransferase